MNFDTFRAMFDHNTVVIVIEYHWCLVLEPDTATKSVLSASVVKLNSYPNPSDICVSDKKEARLPALGKADTLANQVHK